MPHSDQYRSSAPVMGRARSGISGLGRLDHQLLSLALTAGAVDAATYLWLGHAFPANMTGNTVLLAIAVAQGGNAHAVDAALALGGFSFGVVAATVALGRRSGVIRWVIGAHAALLAAVFATGAALGAEGGVVRDSLLAATGVAMGMQAAAVRVADTAGVAATYVTGTVTHALARQTLRLIRAQPDTPRSRRARQLAELDWLAYALGALAGALLATGAARYSFAFAAVTATIASAIKASPPSE